MSSDAPLVMHPSGSVVQVFDLYEGRLHRLLRGHMDTVNACCYNPTLQAGAQPAAFVLWQKRGLDMVAGIKKWVLHRVQELYTGSNDCQIVVWAAPAQAAQGGDTDVHGDEDTWSD